MPKHTAQEKLNLLVTHNKTQQSTHAAIAETVMVLATEF